MRSPPSVVARRAGFGVIKDRLGLSATRARQAQLLLFSAGESRHTRRLIRAPSHDLLATGERKALGMSVQWTIEGAVVDREQDGPSVWTPTGGRRRTCRQSA